MTEARRQIQCHAALRGVAALLVVAYHLQFGGEHHLAIEDTTVFFRRGYLFVDLFFILSGFVISYAGRADRDQPMTGQETRTFLLRRVIRLYPLHLFCLAYLVAFAAATSALFVALGRPVPFDWGAASLASLAGQILLVNAWLPWSASWNIPSWSISAEMTAYALFPLVLLAAHRRPRATAATCAMFVMLFYAGVHAAGGSLDLLNGPWAPMRCIAGFLIGMALFFARHRLAALPDTVLTLGQVSSAVAIVACLSLRISDVAAIPAFALLVGTSWTDRGLLASLLIRPRLLHLGEISYSVYLNHVCVLAIIGPAWRMLATRSHLGPDLARAGWILLAYAAVLVVSNLTFRWIEVPAREALTRRWLGRRATPIEASVPAP